MQIKEIISDDFPARAAMTLYQRPHILPARYYVLLSLSTADVRTDHDEMSPHLKCG